MLCTDLFILEVYMGVFDIRGMRLLEDGRQETANSHILQESCLMNLKFEDLCQSSAEQVRGIFPSLSSVGQGDQRHFGRVCWAVRALRGCGKPRAQRVEVFVSSSLLSSIRDDQIVLSYVVEGVWNHQEVIAAEFSMHPPNALRHA